MLKGLVDPSRELTDEQAAHIDTLQDEIDAIWNARGNYKIDPEAWQSMPIFMDHISQEDVEKNDSCRALASIVYDEVPPDEIAENRKAHGNHALQMALNPAQDRRENLARAACHSYTEALLAKGTDTVLSSTIYANRSLAQFIIGNYGHGLEDAQRSIILNPQYFKAYYRAAKCAERVKKYDLALQLLQRGLECDPKPPLTDTNKQEFQELIDICNDEKAKYNAAQNTLRRSNKVKAAKSSNIAHAITSMGIKMTAQAEVPSEQLAEYSIPQPYLDEDRLLHVPILLMYDEYSQTDVMHDVPADASVEDLLHELLPFPWDSQGRYATPDHIVAFFLIDDHVKMQERYEIDKSWPLLEVFRSTHYVMPRLLPVIHIISRSSELLSGFNLRPLT